MGLQQEHLSVHNGRLHYQSPNPIWTQKLHQTATLTAITLPHHLRHQSPIGNWWRQYQHHLMPPVSSVYRELLDASSTMQKWSTTNSYAHLVPSAWIKHQQRKTPLQSANNYLTILPCIQTMGSPSKLATWYWQHTPMSVTSVNLNHAAKRVHTSSYQTVTLSHNPMDRSSQSPPSWDRHTPQLGKLNWPHSSNVHKKWSPYVTPWKKMGWIQPCSPIQVDNSTAVGYVNNTIIAWRIKSLKMRPDWLKCRELQDRFRIFWDKKSHNLADYHTKHHPPEYHIAHQHSHAGWIMQLHPTQANLRVFLIPLPFFIFYN